ncbi:MAG: sugar transferase [Hyphomicrobiaceae bacterium]
MRRVICLFLDVLILLSATLLALYLRENFEPATDRFIALVPYLTATTIAGFAVHLLFALPQPIWRYSVFSDYVRIAITTAIIVVAAAGLTWGFNRLDGVARSLPFLHYLVAVAMLVATRSLWKEHNISSELRKSIGSSQDAIEKTAIKTILIVGVSRLTETYTQSIIELAPGRIKVAGLLSERTQNIGRLAAGYRILGKPEEIDRIVSNLEVHGVIIDKVVVATAFDQLSTSAQTALQNFACQASTEIQYLANQFGFDDARRTRDSSRSGVVIETEGCHKVLAPQVLENISATSFYWQTRRCIDVIGATFLIVALSPLMLLVGLCVATKIGLPIAFWQQRPGLAGRSFKLFKFRTMKTEYSGNGHKLSDADRTAPIGIFLRRTHLDELPQLFNILKGDMSFIGPRPLLPKDQSDAYRARLMIRPGLTGWAQVNGGRTVSADDKAALDIWYAQNANLRLDIRIIARTMAMLIIGERECRNPIQTAWRDLLSSEIHKTDLTNRKTDKQPLGDNPYRISQMPAYMTLRLQFTNRESS